MEELFVKPSRAASKTSSTKERRYRDRDEKKVIHIFVKKSERRERKYDRGYAPMWMDQ